jgi:translation initiation factor IF-2
MLETRPPIVTVLGHVDHGKTTLLDAIRKTNIAAKEVGGITQSIGASVVETRDGKKIGKITFIDTPGHAAFSKMRSRGAKVADIAILVVASDDGIKPQTKEALGFILEEKIPYIVALTKIDLPSSDPESVKLQLEKEGVLLEGRGGQVPYVLISAKEGKGIKDLMELIVLLSEVNEIKADANGVLEGFVVETKKDKKGLLATIIVRNGKIGIGDKILIEGVITKVKGIFDSSGKPIKEVLPSEPALILGFEKLPEIGSKVQTWSKDAPIVMSKMNVVSQKNLQKEAKLNLVLKARTAGALEAILENISPEVNILDFSVGEINESDVFTAKSQEDVRIFAFELKVPSTVAKLAETEGVKIETFEIIYRLFERVEELIKKPEEEILGKAEVVAIFPYENKKVAGCKVINGKISKNDTLRILRDNKEIGRVKASSMKKEKKDINQASQGEEFGVIFEPQLAFTMGDVIVSVPKLGK